MILCKVIRDTLQSNTYYLGKYHVLLFPDFQVKDDFNWFYFTLFLLFY